MAIASTYSPPSLAVLNSFLAAQPPGKPADHRDESGHFVRVQNSQPTQEGTVLAVSLTPGAGLSSMLGSVLDQADGTVLQRIVRLTIGDVPAPADDTSYLQIFLGRSKVTAGNAAGHPNHFRNVAFICCDSSSGTYSFLFDVTPVLKKLRSQGEAPEKGLTVQVLAGSFRGPAPAVVPSYFQLNVAML